ncbi:MAG: hypothetical protein JRI68_09685 [Deltaproteobacteria bacterium]|nr:hypothetical protein [Deltaproteobacteria bacterium]
MLLLAGSAILLAVPRGVAPSQIPPPLVDGQALAATEARDDDRTQAIQQEPLDVDVRAVGREVRAYNRAAAADREQELTEARRRIVRATAVALRHNAEPLLKLRAYQMRRFIAELRQWQTDGVETDELTALGGDWVRMLRRNSWCRGGTRDLVMTGRVLRVLFKKRWNDITGLRQGPFALTVDEDRLRYGFLIDHPFVRDKQAALPPNDRLGQARRGAARLRMIEKLATRDPSYHANLARGVVLYRLERYAASGEAFRRHLQARPDGPYTLRARNYLKAALDQLQGGAL